MRLMLENGADLDLLGEWVNDHAFTVAIINISVVVTKLLLEHDVDVNMVDNYLYSALQAASWNGQPESMRELLEHVVDLSLQPSPFIVYKYKQAA